MRNSTRALLALIVVCTVTTLIASSTAIGLATANGSFLVNAAKVWGNTTLFDGSIIETAKAASELRLNNGAQFRLGAESRATVYGGRLVLEKGGSRIESAVAYPVEAQSLRIYPAAAGALAQVQLADAGQVTVAALRGAVRVINASGTLVANVAAGNSLSFDPQAGAAAPSKASGCLLRKDGKFIVVDQTANVTLQVQGSGLEKEVGNRVEITGAVDSASPSVTGASQLINVQSVTRSAKGGCASVAKKVGAAAGGAAAAGAAAAGAAGGAAAAGIGAAATVAVVGGVAVAGTVGGLAAAGTFTGEESRPSTSR